jgi:Protein of unknown function (DUF2958)
MMTTYLIQYKQDGKWIPFSMRDNSIHTALNWVHDNIQKLSVCISETEDRPLNTKLDAAHAIAIHLTHFVSKQQLRVLGDACYCEERMYFIDKICDLGKLIETMPKTYEQDGMGDQAIAFLHYFTGSADWYITEKDIEMPQVQAFGLADLGYGGEMGYISIKDLISLGVELDLYFAPKTLKEIRNG